MSLTGHDHLSKNSEIITAEIEHWRKHVHKNFEVVLRIIVSTVNIENNRCVICANLSAIWKSKSSLSSHYRYSHRSQIVEYYLKHYIKLTPDELRKQMQRGDDTS